MATKHPLQHALESLSNEDDSFRVSSYSGRGMHGTECLSVSCSRIGPLVAGVMRYLPLDRGSDVDQVAEAFEDLAQDSLGRGIVVYFPGIKYVESGTGEDEEPIERDGTEEETHDRPGYGVHNDE